MAGNYKKNNRNNSDDDNVRIRKPKKKVCAYCADKNLEIDYKGVAGSFSRSMCGKKLNEDS